MSDEIRDLIAFHLCSMCNSAGMQSKSLKRVLNCRPVALTMQRVSVSVSHRALQLVALLAAGPPKAPPEIERPRDHVPGFLRSSPLAWVASINNYKSHQAKSGIEKHARPHSVRQPASQSVTPSLACSLAKSVTQSATQSLSHSVSHSLTRSLARSPSHSVSHSVSQSVTHSLSQRASQPVS